MSDINTIIVNMKMPKPECILEIPAYPPTLGLNVPAVEMYHGTFVDGTGFRILLAQDYKSLIMRIDGEQGRRIVPLDQIMLQWLNHVGAGRVNDASLAKPKVFVP